MKHILLKENEHYSGDSLAEILSAFQTKLPTGVKKEKNCDYSFTAVGLVLINGNIIKCFPKYWEEYDANRFKQLIKVIERYKKVTTSNDLNAPFSEKENEYDVLSMMLYLLRDYYENGLYSNEQSIIEINGTSYVLWDKTVNEITALISGGRPFYPDTYTRKRIDDEQDFIKQLHKCVLTKCSKELEDAELINLFDLDAVELSDKDISDFGDTEYILDCLQREINIQFNTHKQELLNALYVYISEDKHLSDCCFQTNLMVAKFDLVWEDVCKTVFNNRLESTLDNLAPQTPNQSLDTFFTNKHKKLKELVDYPYWSNYGTSKYTLILDTVCFDKDCFVILDAKYYCPNKIDSGMPGVEDIAKQYLYQLAFRNFYTLQGFKSVKNCFLFPENGDIVVDKGYAELKFLKELLLVTKNANSIQEDNIQLENIQVRFVPTDKLYTLYLSGQTLSIDYLQLH